MATKPDIQYITQFYVPGSEAQVIEFKPARKKRQAKTVLPKAVPEKKIVLRVDRAAVCGIAVAAVMLIMMVVGVFQYLDVCAEHREMTDRVIVLQNENVKLREEYESGYNLEDIAVMAEAMGMVPVQELETISIKVEVPTPEPEPTWWENVCWYFEGLFA